MPREQEISYLIKPEDKNGDRLTDTTYAFLNGKQVNGCCPGVICMRQFWKVPKRKYIVTFRLNPRGKYMLNNSSTFECRDICKIDINKIADFCICLFPRSWRKGTRFDRIVKLVWEDNYE